MRIKRISFVICFSLLLGILAISCETKTEDSDGDHQRTVNNVGQRTITDTANMDEIQGVPVIQAPGAQIDRGKVTAMLNEKGVSFEQITNPNATTEDIQESIEQLTALLDTDIVQNDEALEYFVQNTLGSVFLRLYEQTGKKKHLDQAEKHIDTAISMLKGQPDYKADLVDAYSGRLAVYSLRGEQEKVISLLKKLIEEYQNIGYGLYKNWFSSRQVEKIYNLIRMDSLNDQEVQEIVDYLTKVSEKYENEVGITAQMVLADHYATNGEHEKANRLVLKVEERLTALDNSDFKEQKRERYRTQIESAQKRADETFGQTDRDTLFYEIRPEMIDRAIQRKREDDQQLYYVDVKLKQEYHSDFAQKTTDNIGNFMAIVHNGAVISSSFPTIQTGISSGRFTLGPYEKQEEAKRILRRILDANQ
jgi:tetratricopeptide (TPR) repeat protein